MYSMTKYVLVIALVFVCVSAAQAQIPKSFSYQGVLTGAGGLPVTDGSYTLTFRLYDAATAATPLWTESQSLALKSGIFNVLIGATKELDLPFDKRYFLGISVDGGSELQPRTELSSVPYALVSMRAETASGLEPGASGVVTTLNTLSGDITLEGGGATTITRSGNKITVSSAGGSGGTGIQGVQNTDGTMSVQNPNGPVATLGLADNGIMSTKLQDGSITTAKLAAASVTKGKIAQGEVVKSIEISGTTLRDDVVLEAGSNVTLTPNGNRVTISATGGTGGNGIQSVQNMDGTIAVTNPNGPVATIALSDNGVSTGKLADNAVTALKVANGQLVKSVKVGSVELHDEVTFAAGNNVTLSPSGNTITIAAVGGTGGSGIQGVQNTNGTLDITNGTGPIATINVSANGIRTAHIDDAAVTAAKLAPGLIPSSLPPSGTAGGDLSGTYPNPTIANGAVTTAKLADASVTSAKITDGTIVSADIANGGVSPGKLDGSGAGSGEVLTWNGSAVVWDTPSSSGVSGSGTTNQLAIWNSSSSLTGQTDLVYTSSKLGLGLTNPTATLHVSGNEGVLAVGQYNGGSAMSPGAGARMHWYSRKAAFRAGKVTGTEWDDTNIGTYSFAAGNDAKASAAGAMALGNSLTASGAYSLATGDQTTASGLTSTAMGKGSTASNQYATAMGYQTTASGIRSTAMGWGTEASGQNSTAMGASTTASGLNATAMGAGATASGSGSFAVGYNAVASGEYGMSIGAYTTAGGQRSVAIGNSVSTGTNIGAVMFGDFSTSNVLTATTSNRFYGRFANGYYLYTNASVSVGVSLSASGNSWSSISDSTRKENYRAVDGEALLGKFLTLRIGSWNYKTQDPATTRHYGPMAQEWFAAFGHDGVGVIGDDTTLATADVDGVLCIAIQALERRTAELKTTTEELNARMTELQKAQRKLNAQQENITALQERTSAQEARIEALLARMSNMERLLTNASRDERAVSSKQAALVTTRK